MRGAGMALGLLSCSVTARVLYVDPASAPRAPSSFGSLHGARDWLRTNGLRSEPTTVRIRGDVHLSEPFVLDARDSGTATAPITYASDSGAHARVTGGMKIQASAFKPAQVPSKAVGAVSASLFALGLNVSVLGDLGHPYPTAKLELFYNGRPQVLARDPNIAADVLQTWTWAGYSNMTANANDSSSFHFSDAGRARLWSAALRSSPDSLWLHGYFKFDWRDTFVRVVGISEDSGGLFTVATDRATPPQYPFTTGCRFYALNALELLDAPGEYFVDRSSGELFLIPPSGKLSPDDDLVVSVLDTVVRATGTSHLSFANLTLSVAQGTVVSLTDVSGVSVVNSTVTNSGGACLSLSGVNSTVSGNIVFGCGGSGVSVSGGDIETLASGHLVVVGNSISNYSRVRRTYQPGIGFSGVGSYVAGNSITHGPHCAISGSGCNNLFERNRIRHVSFECTDTGAFYVGRSWAQRGNVARFNEFDTVRPTERLAQRSESQNAFYLDDEMSGWDFYGNVIRNCTTGVLLGGGRHNRIHANRFVDNDRDIAFDNRGMSWQSESCKFNCDASLGSSCFRVALEAVNYTRPPYSTAFSGLADIYATASHPCVPVGNVIEDNRYCHRHSKRGGKFIDRDAATINSWYSSASNNVEDCSAGGAESTLIVA